MNDFTLDDIRGRQVIDTRGTTLGEVQDVLISPDRWEVTGILVNLRNEVAEDLNVQKPTFGSARLNISRERVSTIGENVMLNVDTDSIAGLLRGGTAGGAGGATTTEPREHGTVGGEGETYRAR